MSFHKLKTIIDILEDDPWFFLVLIFVMVFGSLIVAIYAKAKENKSSNPKEDTWQNNKYNTALFRDETINDNRKASINSSKEWCCSNCGRINQNYVGTCGCGETKPKEGK